MEVKESDFRARRGGINYKKRIRRRRRVKRRPYLPPFSLHPTFPPSYLLLFHTSGIEGEGNKGNGSRRKERRKEGGGKKSVVVEGGSLRLHK